jgi:hypothetical protein
MNVGEREDEGGNLGLSDLGGVLGIEDRVRLGPAFDLDKKSVRDFVSDGSGQAVDIIEDEDEDENEDEDWIVLPDVCSHSLG